VRGALVEFTLLPSGNPTDLVVPLAFNASNGLLRTDFVLFDAKAPAGDIVAEFFGSPVPPPPTKSFRVGESVTLAVSNALGSTGLNVGDKVGSVLFTPHVGDTGNYQAATRSYAVRQDGGTYGFALPSQTVASGLTGDSNQMLFLATQPGETSIFGMYSPTGATGVGTLHGPDGSIRGSFPFFLPENNRQEFNPAFSAFGVPAEAGDTITFNATTGTIFPYSTFFEATGDAAVSTPVAPHSEHVAPMAGSAPSTTGKVVTEILLANPDPNVAAAVNLAFFPAGGGTPTERLVAVAAGGSTVVPYEDPALGFGSLIVKSSSPVSALARFANRTPSGRLRRGGASGFLPPSRADSSFPPTRGYGEDLFVFNRGVAGTITVRALNAGGSVVAVQPLPIGDHRSLILPNVGIDGSVGGGSSSQDGEDFSLRVARHDRRRHGRFPHSRRCRSRRSRRHSSSHVSQVDLRVVFHPDDSVLGGGAEELVQIAEHRRVARIAGRRRVGRGEQPGPEAVPVELLGIGEGEQLPGSGPKELVEDVGAQVLVIDGAIVGSMASEERFVSPKGTPVRRSFQMSNASRRPEDARKLPARSLAVEPVKSLSRGDEIDAFGRKRGGLRASLHAAKERLVAEKSFGRRSHLRVRLHREYFVSESKEEERENPRPRADVGHGVGLRKRGFFLEKSDDSLGIAGPRSHVSVDSAGKPVARIGTRGFAAHSLAGSDGPASASRQASSFVWIAPPGVSRLA
jgi:hypothetical protein